MNKETKPEQEFEEINLDENQNILTDETITQDQINEMKMLGLPKPDSVSWDRWQQIQNIRAEHELMIKMAATGTPQKVIAQTLGYNQAQVSKILKTPEVRDQVSKEISSIYGDDYKKAFKDRFNKSMLVVDDTLENGQPKDKADMAKWVLEHTVGKAQQNVQVKGALLADFMIQVEQISQNQLRDVTSNPELLTKKPHKFDTVIEQFVPNDFVVGKRSEGEKQGE